MSSCRVAGTSDSAGSATAALRRVRAPATRPPIAHRPVRRQTMPTHWLDSSHAGGSVDRPWERAEWEHREREEREHQQRLERMARAGVPPPRRDDPRYGPRANNPEGDDAFRKDRRVGTST